MTSTRTEINRSIDATRAALMRLSPDQIEAVREQTNRELLDFIHNEWLRMTPEQVEEAERRKAAVKSLAEIFGRAA